MITEFPVGTSGEFPEGITTGPDGNLWFTENLDHSIAMMTPAGQVTQYPISSDLVLTVRHHGRARMATSGSPTQGADSVGRDHHFGGDHRVQASVDHRRPHRDCELDQTATSGSPKISTATSPRFRSQGVVLDQYTVPGNFPQPDGITVGPDGNI